MRNEVLSGRGTKNWTFKVFTNPDSFNYWVEIYTPEGTRIDCMECSSVQQGESWAKFQIPRLQEIDFKPKKSWR